MLILVNSLDKAERNSIERSLSNIDRGSATTLRKWAKDFDPVIREALNYYGVVATLDELESMLVLSDIIDRHNVYLGYATRNPH